MVGGIRCGVVGSCLVSIMSKGEVYVYNVPVRERMGVSSCYGDVLGVKVDRVRQKMRREG